MTKPGVFLSYAGADQEFVRKLLASKVGESTLATRWPVEPGSDVRERMIESLQRATVILFLVSPSSLGSPWVQFEVGAAFGLGKPVIPVLVDEGLVEHDLPDWIRGVAYVDARGRSIQEVAAEVVRAIEASGP